MENKNNIIIIGLLALIAGLIIGYFSGTNQVDNRPYRNGDGWGMMWDASDSDDIYEEMEEMMGWDEEGGAETSMMSHMMGLSGKTGAAFEEAFLRGMIVHHKGAIIMSRQLLEQTERPELIELANSIISSQSQEIDMMEGWLDAWF